MSLQKRIEKINDLVDITHDLSKVYVNNINYLTEHYNLRGNSEDKLLTNSELIFDRIVDKYKIPFSDTKCQTATYIFSLATYVSFVANNADYNYQKSKGRNKNISLGKLSTTEVDNLISIVLKDVKPYSDWVTELCERLRNEGDKNGKGDYIN